MSSLKIAYSERCWARSARMVGVLLGSSDSSMLILGAGKPSTGLGDCLAMVL